MKILALETSCEIGSVALLIDGELREMLLPGSGAGHSANVLPTVKRLLAEAGLTPAGLDVIAFGAGPGAFTGVRLACGVAQGLALGADRPVAPVDSLEALAEPFDSERLYCAIDARMNEAYVASFRREAGKLVGAMPASCVPPEALPLPDGEGWLGIGTAFRAYPQAAARLADCLIGTHAEAVPTAAAVARLAAAHPQHWCDPALAAPRYVRDRVALTVAERLAQGGKA